MQEPTIADTVTTGTLRVADNSRLEVNPDGSRTARVQANPLYEYVSGGSYSWSASYLKSLPFWIDDTTRDFGDDLYERMLLDPQVASSVDVLKMAVLSQGVELLPAPTTNSAEKALGDTAIGFCRRCLGGLESPLTTILFDMLDAVALGNRLAELIYMVPKTGRDAGRLCLRNIKPKPRRSVAFVTDVYLNIAGILGLIPGQGAPILVEGMIGEPEQVPNLLPRRKFAVLSFRPHNADPRGQSVLRPAYNAWWMKMQLYPEYLKFMTQFASPSLIGITDADAQGIPVTDSEGNPIPDVNGNTQYTYPEQILLTQLLALHNSTAIVVPHGTEVKPLVTPGDGTPFLAALTFFNKEIAKAILCQTLATDEGQHESRSAAQTHQDVLQLVISHAREALKAMLEQDVLRPLVEYNFGEDAARLTPRVRLADIPQQDVAGMGAAVAALQSSGFIDPSQYAGIDAMLNLPARQPL